MDENYKDIADVIAKSVATVGGLIAAFKAIREYKLNRITNQRDLRWKQASSAKQLIDEMFSEPKSKDASLMLDWESRYYDIEGQSTKITTTDIKNALRVQDMSFSLKESYIRDCFEMFLYYIELAEQSLENELFEQKDITFFIGYYAGRLKKTGIDEPLYKFLDKYYYTNSIKFFKRFGLWPNK